MLPRPEPWALSSRAYSILLAEWATGRPTRRPARRRCPDRPATRDRSHPSSRPPRARRQPYGGPAGLGPGRQCPSDVPRPGPSRQHHHRVDPHARKQIAGVDATELDEQMRTLRSMIRDSIDPDPPVTVRPVPLDGKTVLLIEVSAGGRWYAYNPKRPEFYLRRGASTVPGTAAGDRCRDRPAISVSVNGPA
ncbi:MULTISPECIES: ATP-binding protein [unclassified Micromonospora]